MKVHLTIPSAVFISLITAALATGSTLLFLLAFLTVLTVAMCLAGVTWASATMHVSAETSADTVCRGDDVSIQLRVQHKGWIPIAPVLLELGTTTGEGRREIRLKNLPGRVQMLRMSMHASHVGVFSSGIRSCTIEDLLGIFQKKINPADTQCSLTVLPQICNTEPLIMRYPILSARRRHEKNPLETVCSQGRTDGEEI